MSRAGSVLLALALLPALGACSERPRPAPPPGRGFVDRTDGSGVDFRNHTGPADVKRYIVEAKGGGVLVLDFDGDGDDDLYFVDGNSFTQDAEGRILTREADPAAGNRLYRNEGGWRFADVTRASGTGDPAFGVGGTVGDYDGDGDPDLYVCNWGPNRLYRNEGGGRFVEVAAAAGVAGDPALYSTCAAFFDMDGDADLDLYVSNYADIEALTRERRGAPAGRVIGGVFRYEGPGCYPPQVDLLFENRGDGTFRDASDRLVDQEPSYGFQPVPADLDDDGDADLYVANDSMDNFLWVNDGTGRFTDRAFGARVARDAYLTAQAGMGVDVGDFDQDGRLDIAVTNFAQDTNTLYRNRSADGELLFEDVSEPRGLGTADFDKVSWGVALRDFDLDGFLDLFFVSGHVYPPPDPETLIQGSTYEERAMLLLGSGPPGWTFRDAGEEGGPGLETPRVGRGAAFADLDGDGDLDVAATCLNRRAVLLENRLADGRSWLRLRLAGRGGNRDAIGARVTVTAEGGRIRQVQEHRLAGSFGSSLEPALSFGLDGADAAERVEVRWPSGERRVFRGVGANRTWRLVEGEDRLRE